MLSIDAGAATSSTRRRSRRPSAPGSASATCRPGRADRADRRARDQHLHLAEHGRRSDRQRVLRLRRARPLDRDGPRGARGARRHARGGAAASRSRTRRSSSPDGGYFLWLDAARRDRRPRRCSRAAAEHGVAIVSGDDFVIDGGSGAVRLAYSGVTPEEIREGVGAPGGGARGLSAGRHRRGAPTTSGRRCAVAAVATPAGRRRSVALAGDERRRVLASRRR